MANKPVLFVMIGVLLAGMLSWCYFNLGLPYGKLSPDSEKCQSKELFGNRSLCIRSGCNWGSGDLTGPPFCGAYK